MCEGASNNLPQEFYRAPGSDTSGSTTEQVLWYKSMLYIWAYLLSRKNKCKTESSNFKGFSEIKRVLNMIYMYMRRIYI